MEYLLTEVLRMRAVSLDHTRASLRIADNDGALYVEDYVVQWCSTIRDTQSEVYSSICVCVGTKDGPIPCSAVSIAQ